MTAPTNHWKLGLFVVVAVSAAFVTAVWLGTVGFRKENLHYVSYFDETVTGLDIGSPVSFRGVNIGNVSNISIAPDRRHVQVDYEMGVDVLSRMGLTQKLGDEVLFRLNKDVRVQVTAAGVTGVKYVKLDYLPDSPVVTLGFKVPRNYIPASPSTMKSLEDSVLRAMEKVPAVVEKVLVVLEHADGILVDFQASELPERAVSLIAQASRTVQGVERTMQGVDTAGISRSANQALADFHQVLGRADVLLSRVDSEAGLLDSVQRTSDAMGDVASNARTTGPKLEQTLDNVSELTYSLQRLLNAIERDPDMLLKGRARSTP